MTKPPEKAGCKQAGQVIPFPTPKPRLRAGVPPFDPTNPAHLRAWEAIWDFAQSDRTGGNRHD
jgi:hypothetical protein